MEKSCIRIEKENPFDVLLPKLTGKIFHVSRKINLEQIELSGKIKPSNGGDFITTFGSKSYFGNKGCICLFDYRDIDNEKSQKFIHRCRPTDPLMNGNEIVIFMLSERLYSNVLPWNEWENNGGGTNVVPYVEVGYPGEIYLSDIDHMITVSYEEDKDSMSYKMRTILNNAKH